MTDNKSTDNQERRDGGGNSFWANGMWYMQRCHSCRRENYALSVATGKCAWCGFDANNKETPIEGEN